MHEDGNPSLVISCIAEYKGGEVTLHPQECDAFAWVTLKEAKGYALIDGIYDELLMAENRKKGITTEWQRK